VDVVHELGLEILQPVVVVRVLVYGVGSTASVGRRGAAPIAVGAARGTGDCRQGRHAVGTTRRRRRPRLEVVRRLRGRRLRPRIRRGRHGSRRAVGSSALVRAARQRRGRTCRQA
jgi:hypothetical protein